jgi:hypothetical protein
MSARPFANGPDGSGRVLNPRQHRLPAWSGCARKVRIPVIETPDWNDFKARKCGRRSQIRDAKRKKLGARPASGIKPM